LTTLGERVLGAYHNSLFFLKKIKTKIRMNESIIQVITIALSLPFKKFARKVEKYNESQQIADSISAWPRVI
jgi:hypothetical protein